MVAILGHRGASAHAVENTIEAFVLAMERGAHGVELDVQLSADGEVVVFHDETLDRLAETASGPLRDRAWSELRRVPLRDGAAIPRLEDVLRALPPESIVNVELKSFGNVSADRQLCEAVARVVHGRSMTVCSSFSVDIVRSLVASGMPEPTLITEDPGRTTRPDFLAALGARGVHLWDGIAQEGLIGELLAADLTVGVWTVNDLERRRELTELGAGRIITDSP